MEKTQTKQHSQAKQKKHTKSSALKSIFHPFNLVLLLPFIYNPFYGANPSEIPKLSFFLVILAALTIYHLFKSSEQKYCEFKINKNIIILIALFIFSAVLSTVFSISPRESLFGFYFDAKGLIPLLCWVLFFFYAFSHFKENKDQSLFLIAIEIVGLACSIYAIFQRLTMDYSTIFGAGQLFGGRVYAFFSNPNDFGEYLIFPFFAALVNLITNKQRKIKYLHISSLLLISTALVFSVNRASILAVIVGLVIYFFLKIKNRKAKLISGIITLSVIIFGLVIFLTSARSLLSRLVLWGSSLQLAIQNPLIGFGLSTFPSAIQPVLSPNIYLYEQMMALPNHPHNETLSLLLSQGLFGLAIAGIFLFLILHKGIKKALTDNDSLLHFAVITVVATIITAQFTYLQITHIAYLAISLAVICALAFNNNSKSKPRDLTIRFSWIKYPLGLIIIFLTLFLSVKLATTDHLLGKAMGKTFSNPPEAVIIFDQLLSDNQFYAYPYDTYFTLLEDQFFTDPNLRAKAREYLKQYGIITNYNYQFYSYSGMIAYSNGNKSLGAQEFEIAANLAPASARICADFMSAAQNAGDLPNAKKAAQTCYNFLPDYMKDFSPAAITKEAEIFLKSNPVYYQIMSLMK